MNLHPKSISKNQSDFMLIPTCWSCPRLQKGFLYKMKTWNQSLNIQQYEQRKPNTSRTVRVRRFVGFGQSTAQTTDRKSTVCAVDLWIGQFIFPVHRYQILYADFGLGNGLQQPNSGK